MAKILTRDVYVLVRLFRAFARGDYRNAIWTNDPSKQFQDGTSWCYYFQARAGALLVQKEVVDFLLGFETVEAAKTIPYCNMETAFSFHSDLDLSHLDALSNPILGIVPETKAELRKAAKLIETIRKPSLDIFDEHAKSFWSFAEEESKRARNLETIAIKRRSSVDNSSLITPESTRRSTRQRTAPSPSGLPATKWMQTPLPEIKGRLRSRAGAAGKGGDHTLPSTSTMALAFGQPLCL